MSQNETASEPAPTPANGVSAEFISHLTSSQRQLYAFILSLVRHTADADDVLQETNLVMWRKWADFTPGTNFDAWSFSIARFQVMAHRKRQQRSRLHFDDELVDLLASEAATAYETPDPRRRALSDCLRKLGSEQRRLIARRYEPGGSVIDMATEQGRSPKAVSEALRRIRKTLMTCIETTLAREASP
ncbi:MAG: sigma-70 family RNA polymerase sigma factor [Verrucomicrobiae bacterium]|nr:sigma-70 family RNA polymerase sigma factor [Verrucomicrobiae bacterium]